MLETLFFKLLEISIQASFFILAIIFIRLCFKRLPKRYVCILWGLVALRLILPVQITSEFSLVPDTSRVQNWAEMEVATPDDISTNAPSAGNVNINIDTPDHGDVSMNTTTPQTGNISVTERLPQDNKVPMTGPVPQDDISSTITPDATDSKTSATLSIPTLLAILWCAGMIILLGYGLISYLRTKLHLREAVHDTDNIWYCDSILSPFVMGYVKPRIYIPFSVEQADLPYIIAHEKSHIAHFDHLGKLLGYVLLCVYWFNPFIWVAYVLYCKDLELACDERVINKLGDSERKPYSQALLTCSVTNKALLQSPLAFSEVAIKERIINILNYKKPGFWGIVLAVLACVVAVVCFMTSPETTEDADLRQIKTFIEELTPDDLATVTQDYSRTHAEYNTADPYSLEGLYLLDNKPEKDISLYGLSNHKSMIVKDGDNIYPLYMAWLDPHSITPQIFKGDYDKDGTAEYALYTLGSNGTGMEIYSLTVLEVTGNELTPYLFEGNDIQEQFKRITFEYLPNDHSISIYADNHQVIVDVSYLEILHQTTAERLVWGNYIDFEERDGQWWITTDAGVIPKVVGALLPDYSCGAVFSAPVIYTQDHAFQIGEITITPVNANANAENNPDILTVYADQLEAFPGKCSVDEAGNLVTKINVTDYECAITTSSITSETVYYWSERTEKTYPLEIKNGKVQDVPARIVTEKEILEYAFGEELIQMTYKVHPHGIKQYILRENGIIHVNIGYDYEYFINLQYLGFQISGDGQSVTLSENGLGYYLLQVNDTSGLKAFRETYTGEGHMIPSDSTHLPWEWLLTLNGEELNIPQIHVDDVPVIDHSVDFPFYWANIHDFYNGFIATEIRNDDELLTEYRYKDETDDLAIYTTNHQDIVSLIYNGQEKEFPSSIISDVPSFDIHSGGGGHHSLPHFTDVTGDGKKEFFLDMGAGGTGTWDNDCIIFNLDTMEQLTFDKNILHITSQLQVTLEEFDPEEGNLLYRLEYNGQSGVSEMGFSHEQERHATMLEPGVTLEEANEYFGYTPDEETHNISYNPERDCFEMEIWIWANNTYYGQYIGELSADYIWDADANQFVIDLDTVKLETY